MSVEAPLQRAAPAGADAAPARLRLTELFVSLQGEAAQVGWPTVFVRLSGCPLRCRWCDTEYAFEGGESTDTDEVTRRVLAESVRHVCVTGGEPLAQPGSRALIAALCDAGRSVTVETSGAMDVSDVDPRAGLVMDWKAPSSCESGRNRQENLGYLGVGDQLKLVLANRADFEWARDVLPELGLDPAVEVLFSPVFGELEPRLLADWIVAERLPVRFQLQLHKLLWGEEPGR